MSEADSLSQQPLRPDLLLLPCSPSRWMSAPPTHGLPGSAGSFSSHSAPFCTLGPTCTEIFTVPVIHQVIHPNSSLPSGSPFLEQGHFGPRGLLAPSLHHTQQMHLSLGLCSSQTWAPGHCSHLRVDCAVQGGASQIGGWAGQGQAISCHS